MDHARSIYTQANTDRRGNILLFLHRPLMSAVVRTFSVNMLQMVKGIFSVHKQIVFCPVVQRYLCLDEDICPTNIFFSFRQIKCTCTGICRINQVAHKNKLIVSSERYMYARRSKLCAVVV